ncbi:hypothetical protein [Legionella septentrionalis]|uniref:Uncharacterized protein n=1 Tax=Legionella septentrionalis TaxID=2498109 RepID=A0A3S1CM47_9GAMM|nr:hypothetical protein [Legionella septentrionalis]RUQ89745.1 hypothetical protein EKM59_03020 [Legionella septentrionalis]RUR14439.1 hypothetical protein ELY10_08785 [Legionella septentrionalis]
MTNSIHSIVPLVDKGLKYTFWRPYRGVFDVAFTLISPVTYPAFFAVTALINGIGALFYLAKAAVGFIASGYLSLVEQSWAAEQCYESALNSLKKAPPHMALTLACAVITLLSPLMTVIGAISRIGATVVEAQAPGEGRTFGCL